MTKFVKVRNWAMAQNRYVWAAGLGGFGVLDIVVPGSAVNHGMGLLIVLVAIYMWLVQ